MDIVKSVVARLVPLVSGLLVSYGVTTSHAEAIALGIGALGLTVIELIQKRK